MDAVEESVREAVTAVACGKGAQDAALPRTCWRSFDPSQTLSGRGVTLVSQARNECEECGCGATCDAIVLPLTATPELREAYHHRSDRSSVRLLPRCNIDLNTLYTRVNLAEEFSEFSQVHLQLAVTSHRNGRF